MQTRNFPLTAALLGCLSSLSALSAEPEPGKCATCVDGPEMFEHRKADTVPEVQPRELSEAELADIQEVCLRANADRCFGPSYGQLTETDLRARNGNFVLSCEGTDKINDSYRKACIKRFQKAHAALSRKWQGTFEFFPLRESDVQPSLPCVDFTDKSGALVNGWCWEQLQVRIRFEPTRKAGD